MTHLLLWGNAYAQIIRNGKGEVIALYPLMPNRMTVDRDEKGQLYYEYQTSTDEARTTKGGTVRLRLTDVLHIPGLGFDGLVGYSPIAMAKNAIGLAIATEEYGSKFYANGAAPSVVLEHPGTLRDPSKVRDSWNQTFGGSSNSHKIAVLEEGMKYTPISISPNEAQFLETRKFQIDEIARIFRVPPHMVGDLEKSSFSNIEQQSLEFVKYTLEPWIVRWEQNMMRSLLSPGEKKDYFIKFNVDGLLCGDYQSRITRCLGGRWNHQRIKDLLSNEKYLGNALLQKKYRNNHLEKKLVKNEGELAQYYAEGTHDAIIDEETFAKAQEIIRNIEKKREGCKKPELCAFSGMIICSDCGAKYKRTTNKGKHSWQCTTFLTKGKIFCPSKQIPEEEVYRTATEALKLDEFDSLIFQDKIKNIIAEDNYILTFCFKDGTEISEKWIPRSRKNSWTDEMRECARQRVLKQRGRT